MKTGDVILMVVAVVLLIVTTGVLIYAIPRLVG